MINLIQNKYLQFLIIIIISVIIAKIFHLILTKSFKKIKKRNKDNIAGIILTLITKPIFTLIIFIGLYFGLKILSILQPYVAWINKIFFIIFTLLVSLIIARILAIFTSSWLKVKEKFEKTPRLITKIVSITIYLIAILIIMDHFHIQITPLVTALGLGGLAVALAFQSTLSNFFAGLHIISDRPVNIGDYVELEGDISGYIMDIGWRSTKIKTLPNNIVIIPNSKLAESIITNESMPKQEMSVVVQCGVSYNSNLDKVEKVTIDVAKKIQKTIKGAVKSFEPFIRYHTFGDSNINFSVILRVEKPVDKYLVVHEFIKALKKRYDKEKIEISYPITKVFLDKEHKK